jgi:hypothetical protein
MAYQSQVVVFTTNGVATKQRGTITDYINQPFQFEAKRKAYITCLSIEMTNYLAIPSTFTLNTSGYNIQFILPNLIESTISGNGSSDYLFFIMSTDEIQSNYSRKITAALTPALYGTTCYNFSGSLFPWSSTTKRILASSNDFWGLNVLDDTGLKNSPLLTYFNFSLICRIDNYY